MVAPLTDILTLTEAKAAVKNALTASVDDTMIAGYVTAVSQKIDVEFGPVVVREVVDELYGYGGICELRTTTCPVKSFTSVTEYVNTVAQVLTAEDYDTTATYGYFAERYSNDPSLYSGFLSRRTSGSPTVFGSGPVRIVYQAGRYTDTASVAAIWKWAAATTLKNLWRAEELSVNNIDPGFDVPAQSFPGFALPNAVVEMLGQERNRHPSVA